MFFLFFLFPCVFFLPIAWKMTNKTLNHFFYHLHLLHHPLLLYLSIIHSISLFFTHFCPHVIHLSTHFQSTPETYIQNIRRWLIPFLARCDKAQPGRASSLLRAYMVATAKTDLGLPLKILQVNSSIFIYLFILLFFYLLKKDHHKIGCRFCVPSIW